MLLKSNSIGKEFHLSIILGWPFDTSVALAKIVFSGILEKYPNLKLIAAHSGGMIPYFIERIDGFHKMFKENDRGLDEAGILIQPSKYFKKMYYDTAIFYQPALMCVYSLVGSEGLILGTDYPYGPFEGKQFIKQSLDSVKKLQIKNNEKQKILGENAKRLLRL